MKLLVTFRNNFLDVLTFEESADIHDENKTKTLFLMEQTKAFIPKYPVYRQTA